MTKLLAFKKQKFVYHLFYPICIFLIIIVSSCGDSDYSFSSSEAGSAYFSIKWHDAPTTQHYERAAILDCEAAEVERITCGVYDISNFYLTAGGPWECSVGTGTITNIRPGTSRKFIVLGKDINENVMYHGEIADIIITAGDTTNVGIIDVYSFVPTLSSPADGSSVTSNAFSLQWNVTQGAEEYRIVVSEDSGFSTTIIDETITSTTYTPVGLSTSTTYYWKVYARDIHSNISADSEIWSFTTTATINEIPTATITSPTDSSTFTAGDTITFNGTGNDVEDGTLTGSSLVWTSSIDGNIGTGASFSITSLSTGTHTITFTATDSNSAPGTDSIGIAINPIGNTLPTATISAPTDGSTYNEASNITFSGSGNDTEDGVLSGSSLVWTSSINGQIGTGISFSRNDLSVGTHTITLTATDSDGATGSDSVDITIEGALVLYLPFDGNANDESGNGYHGTEYGGVEYVAGINGQAVSLDGIDDYILLPNTSSLNFEKNISISFWIKLETSAPYYYPYHIIEKFGSWGIGQRKWDINAAISCEAWSSVWVTNLEPEVYYYFVWTFDGSVLKLYKDGVLAASDNCAGTIQQSTSNIIIGEYHEGGNYYFDGIIDEMKIYNRVLSQSEIEVKYLSQ